MCLAVCHNLYGDFSLLAARTVIATASGLADFAHWSAAARAGLVLSTINRIF